MATLFSCDKCKRPVSDKSKLYDLSSCSRIKTRGTTDKIIDKRDSPTFKYEVCESCAIKIHRLILN